MRECPNCGQPAARTEDWACQWCGYPLVSGSYEKMPKTYKELKEEKLTGQKLPETKLPKRELLVREEIEATPLPSYEILPPTHTPEPESELTSTAIEVTVEELCSAYETDKVATGAKFTGRVVKVTGIVDRIVEGLLLTDVPNTDVIVLGGADEEARWFILCEFDKEHDPELNQLPIGEMITVQGKCDGSEMDIHIRDCVLVGRE